MLVTAAAQAGNRFAPKQVGLLANSVESYRRAAKIKPNQTTFVNNPQHDKLLKLSCQKSATKILNEIDLAPPHFLFEEMKEKEGPARYLKNKLGFEKHVFLLQKLPDGKTGLILASNYQKMVGAQVKLSKLGIKPGDYSKSSACMDNYTSPLTHETVISAWSPIETSLPDTEVILIMEAPTKTISAFSKYIFLGFASTFGWIIPITIIVSVWISRRLNRPIALLSEGMNKIASGNPDAKISKIPQSNDEFEKLLENYNRMVDGLSERDMFARWLKLAKDIQQHLLPPDQPQIAGLDIFGAIDYCDETGGDYLDYIDLENGKTGIAVGDVTGHGIGAALLMASGRAVLRSHTQGHDNSLAELFDDINVHMVRDTGDARFLTLFYAEISHKTRSFSYVSAGHDPALLFKKQTGQIEMLNNTGIPLGIIETAKYEQSSEINLAPGDVLIVLTDGIREAKNERKEEFGLNRLEKIVKSCNNLSAQEIHDRIIDRVREFQGQETPDDDITLVVIRRSDAQ